MKLQSNLHLQAPGAANTSNVLEHLTQRFPALQQTLESLTQGEEEEILAGRLIQEHGEEALPQFYYVLEWLKKQALIIYKTELLELFPFNAQFVPLPKVQEGIYHLSPFALLRSVEGQMIAETPLSPVRIHLTQEITLPLLHWFCKPMLIAEVYAQFNALPRQELEETLALLQAAQILTAQELTSVEQQWEFHDLYFHSRSRKGRQGAAYGGHYPFIGQIPPLPCIKPPTSHPVVPLKRPASASLVVSLDEVMQTRKSIREHADPPLTADQLGEFLFRCAHVKQLFTGAKGDECSKRPYPGGGARYELEIYPIIHNCQNIPSGAYHYDPLHHVLHALEVPPSQWEKLLVDACQSAGKKEAPQVLFCISARFQRVSWKYRSMAYAVILKDVGVLYQTMYLVGSAMGLAPCALGGGDSDLFCQVIGTHYLEETSVGEFMLGSAHAPKT